MVEDWRDATVRERIDTLKALNVRRTKFLSVHKYSLRAKGFTDQEIARLMFARYRAGRRPI